MMDGWVDYGSWARFLFFGLLYRAGVHPYPYVCFVLSFFSFYFVSFLLGPLSLSLSGSVGGWPISVWRERYGRRRKGRKKDG